MSLIEWRRRGGWDERQQPKPDQADVDALWLSGHDSTACLYSADAARGWGRAVRRAAPGDLLSQGLAVRFADFTEDGAFRAEWGG